MKERKTRSFILRTVGLVGSVTFLSRVTGMLRDVVTASFFGTGYIWDAFVVAFRIPNLFRRLFGEGALSGAVVPVVTEVMAVKGREEGNRLINIVVSVVAVFLALLSLLLVIAVAGMLVFTPELGARLKLVYRLLLVMSPYLMFICLAGVMMGVLNALGHFFIPAFSPVVLNVVLITTVLALCPVLAPGAQIYAVAAAVVVASALQLAAHFFVYRAKGMRTGFDLRLREPGMVRIYKLMVPSVLGLSIYQINILISSFMAVSLGAGAVSSLYYADRLMEFPQGLFGVSIATAVLPVMSRKAAERDFDALRDVLHYGLKMCLLIMIPACAGYLALGVPIVGILFEHGRFGRLSTLNTATALNFYALGLFAFAGARVLTQAFYSLQDMKTPVRIGAVVVAVNLIANLVLMRFMAHAGLAFANSLSGMLNFYLLLRFMDVRLGRIRYGELAVCAAKACAASAVMAVSVYRIYAFGADFFAPAGLMGRAALLFAALSSGVVLTAALYWVFGVSEVISVLRSVFRRLGGAAAGGGK